MDNALSIVLLRNIFEEILYSLLPHLRLFEVQIMTGISNLHVMTMRNASGHCLKFLLGNEAPLTTYDQCGALDTFPLVAIILLNLIFNRTQHIIFAKLRPVAIGPFFKHFEPGLCIKGIATEESTCIGKGWKWYGPAIKPLAHLLLCCRARGDTGFYDN